MIRKKIALTVAVIFYMGGLLFGIFIASLVTRGNTSFNLSGLVICYAGVFVPIVIATVLLVLNTDGFQRRRKIMKGFLVSLFAFYDLILVALLFRSGFRSHSIYAFNHGIDFMRNVNLVPFKTIGTYISAYHNHSMNSNIVYQNIYGNLFLFAPFGIMLPCIFRGLKSFARYFAVMLVILVGVELLQLFTSTGSCDVDDVILNMTGAVVFYGIWRQRMVQELLKKIYAVA